MVLYHGQSRVFLTRAGLQLRPFKYDSMNLRHALLVTDAKYKKQKKYAGDDSDLDEVSAEWRACGFTRRARLRARRNSSRRKRSRHEKASRYRAATGNRGVYGA